MAACVAKPDHLIAAEGGQAFAAIGFHVPEPPAFAAVGLHKEVETVAVEELVLALLRYRNRPLVLKLPLLTLATPGIRRNAKTKKPARRRVFRGFQRF